MPEQTFRKKVLGQVAADPTVAPVLKLALQARDLHRRMMEANRYDLDPVDGIKQLKSLLAPCVDGPSKPEELQVVHEKIHALSNPVIAGSLRDAARKNCQGTTDVVEQSILALLEVAIPAAQNVANGVLAAEAEFLDEFDLEHMPLPPLRIAQSVADLFAEHLKSVRHCKTNMTLPLTPNVFSATFALFAVNT